jgi:hypothetical protein
MKEREKKKKKKDHEIKGEKESKSKKEKKRAYTAIRQVDLVANHKHECTRVLLSQTRAHVFQFLERGLLRHVEHENVAVHEVVTFLRLRHVAKLPERKLAFIAIVQIDCIGDVIPISITEKLIRKKQ